MVPPAAPPTPPSSTAPAGPRWWIAAVVAGLLVSFVVGSAFLPVPSVAMRPGTARPVTQYVTVRGATSYPPAESIATLTLNTRPNPQRQCVMQGKRGENRGHTG